MQFDRRHYSDQNLVALYDALLLPRMIEEKMLKLLRQGRVSKWFSGICQEAISVGSTMALHPDEWVMPLHRNLGVFTVRGVELQQLFAQWQGKRNGFSKGRERSFHFGTKEHHICGMISHLGPQLAIANGVALKDLIDGAGKISVAYSGDGGTSEGDFHEALNVAAVWDLPVIFIIENNGYGLSTPSSEQFRCKQFIDKGIGYGMRAVQVDGNNILDVYSAVETLSAEMRENPHPVLLECMTFRMRGHEEASGTKYVPQELFDEWAKKDPLESFERYLIEEGVLSQEDVDQKRAANKAEIANAWEAAEAEPTIIPSTEEEVADVYAPFTQPTDHFLPNASPKREIRFIEAITEGLREGMKAHRELVLMGQDIAEYGGAFKVTQGFVEEFGKPRVRNTPLCESAIVGAALGMSLRGGKAMMEMQFADFVTVGFNQIINNLAKIHYRWGQNADVVIRMPTGAGTGAGPFHSQSNEAWFFHTPGLKIVYPSTPEDAKGLLLAAFEDPNPYLFFEHKALYRSLSGAVPEGHYTTEIGKARIAAEGDEIAIITYGAAVHWCVEAAEELRISAEIVDLRTLLPWDEDAVRQAVAKCGRVLVAHEDSLTGGIGAEIAAWISEHCFQMLDAPVKRVGSLDTPVPFNLELEKNFLPHERIKQTLNDLSQF